MFHCIYFFLSYVTRLLCLPSQDLMMGSQGNRGQPSNFIGTPQRLGVRG